MKSKNYKIKSFICKDISCDIYTIDKLDTLISCSLFFGDFEYGDSKDLIYLSYLFAGFKKINESIEINIDDPNSAYDFFFKNLNNNNESKNTYRYLLSFGTFSDDLISFTYSYRGKFYILWKYENKLDVRPYTYSIEEKKFHSFFLEFEEYFKAYVEEK